MKVLTVRQPWAELLVTGVKDIENRTWRSAYRGPLLIHAAQTVDAGSLEALIELLAKDSAPQAEVDIIAVPRTGQIVGLVEMVDCVTAHRSDWFEGPYGFVVVDPLRFFPGIPMKGRLGLYDLPVELKSAVDRAVRDAIAG